MATFRRICSLILLAGLLASCDGNTGSDRPLNDPETKEVSDIPAAVSDLSPVRFADLADWRRQDVRPAILAFRKTCASFETRDPETHLSQSARYAGKVKDWLPACSVLTKYVDAGEYHRFFEDYFAPFELVSDDPINKLTGYYEPELLVSDKKTERFSAPIPLRPKDLVEVRLGQFDPTLEGKTVWGRVQNGSVILYPERADIEILPDRVLAWAEPADVFFLQIQGSGRLKFTNGRLARAGFDSHNHRPFGSLANHLIKTGELQKSDASMQGIRAWFEKVGPRKAADAMNVNPRFVFFRERSVLDDSEGPLGAAGLPLTPMGSLAVDLEKHALGVPFFLTTTLPNEASGWKGEASSLLLISQDAGGAIKGLRRGDIFFGWGDRAGSLAGRMNHEGRFFVFLPQGMVLEPAA